ncbi:metallophosphoesterase [Aureimonas sp. AU40]|uniref:metallophosphoesterase n=1 Tax=Aureimonas sp. AU40 TaxID=1637747 RepID=UPI0009E9542F|nr:metallophosphoesterase [Aureimonas sp. AU40]
MNPAPCPPVTRHHAIPNAIERIVAIGDVHGRADCLSALLRHVEATDREREKTAIVFLGDLVDRGPASREVLALAAGALARWPDSVLCLGNHDDWFRRFLLGDPEFADGIDLWLMQGGEETLLSFGVDTQALGRARDTIRQDHPEILDLLAASAMLATFGPFVFVHAGIDPKRSIEAQRNRDCLWIRSPFLDHRGPLPGLVLHGHTPQTPSLAHITENRVSLDTSAFATGVLTAVDIDVRGGEARFWATQPGSLEITSVEPRLLERGFGTAVVAKPGSPGVYALRPAS